MEIGIRWTIGDVSDRGFEALRLSVWGCWRIFGHGARYIIGLNSISIAEAQNRTGVLPAPVRWLQTDQAIPGFLYSTTDKNMAQGVVWKMAPLRLFPESFELSLDNDCILWAMPSAMQDWLNDSNSCLLAADVTAAFGAFSDVCDKTPLNSGIRGLPPNFDLEAALKDVLARNPVVLRSELDEQGLSVAALTSAKKTHVISVQEVTICSPFPPHVAKLGESGAHFVGANCRDLPWRYYDRPAIEVLNENWLRFRPEVYRKIKIKEETR